MIYSLFISLINALIRGLGTVLSFLFSVFPDSPFQKYIIANDSIMDFLGMINYFVPVAEMVVTTEAVLVAVGIYYIYQVVARWLKVIE